MIARIATFEGGDAEEMRRRNNELLVERATELPAGILRVMVLMKDESRWSVISFFDSEEAAAAAEERFEQTRGRLRGSGSVVAMLGCAGRERVLAVSGVSAIGCTLWIGRWRCRSW